jgi:uncharacterized membrane protein
MTTSVLKKIGQAALGAVLLTTGTSHLTVARKDFQAQVPDWFPIDPDTVVLVSGVVELALGTALLTTWRQPARARLGAAVSAFFVGIFPGNLAQYTERKDGFGLDTDRKRALRLLGQPVLVAWAWAATRS